MLCADRDEHGNMLPPAIGGGPVPSDDELFAYQCFLLGLRDPSQVARARAERDARREGRP